VKEGYRQQSYGTLKGGKNEMKAIWRGRGVKIVGTLGMNTGSSSSTGKEKNALEGDGPSASCERT